MPYKTAARVVKLPLQARRMLRTATTTLDAHGVPQLVRRLRKAGSIPSSARDVHARGAMKDSARLMPPILKSVPIRMK